MKPDIMFFCPSFSSGGVEKVLINLANYFSLSGYTTSFLICQRIGEMDALLEPEVSIHSFHKRLSESLIPMYKYFRLRQPDVIICGPQFVNLLTVFVLKILLRSKTRVILTHHNFYDLDVKKVPLMPLFNKSLLSFFYKKSDAIVAVSNAVKNHLVSDFVIPENQVSVIYNPVLDGHFQVNKVETLVHKWYHADKKHKVIVCVGRLSKVKNPEGIVRLMPELIKQLDCRLILIGAGEQYTFLEELITELRLEEYIDLVGAVINPIKYISKADLLVLPSVTETFSLVAVESIASGTPVLSTPTQGVLEILKDCEGCYFEPIQDQAKFIEKIVYLLSNQNLNVDVDFVDRFKVEAVAVQYENLVRKMYG